MKSLAFFFILLLFAPTVSATAINITIYGTNASNAQQNITKYDADNLINVTAWGTGTATKTFWVNNYENATDTLYFNISNITAYQVMQMTVNGTVVKSGQASAQGMLNISHTTNMSNKTYSFTPAPNTAGANFTWAWFWNKIYQNGNEVVDVSNTAYLKNDSIKNSTITWERATNGSLYGTAPGGVSYTIQYSMGCIAATNYQNLNSTAIFVTAIGSNTITLKTDSTATPTTLVSQHSPSAAETSTVSGIILPNNYWRFDANAAVVGCTIWR